MTKTDTYNLEETHYGDSSSRPDLFGILIPGKRGKIFSALYTAGGPGPHPTVLMMHGIPGNERNFDLAQALRRSGFHVMTFHYSGCWGSDGDYSLSHDLEDANTVLDYIMADDTYGFDKSHIYAIGHSLGGFVCGQLSSSRKEIQAATLLMPCDIGRTKKSASEDPATYDVVKDIMEGSAPWLHGTSAELLLKETMEHADKYALESCAEGLVPKPLLCVTGSLDVCTPSKYNCKPLMDRIKSLGGDKVKHIEFPTDHFFSDYRLTVANEVITFLRSQYT